MATSSTNGMASTGTSADSTGSTAPTSGEGNTSSTSGEIESSTGLESSTGIDPFCGDATVDRDEECDDGNDEDFDACSNACLEQFFAGSVEPCTAGQSIVCNYFNAACQRTISSVGGGAVCYWEDYSSSSETCDETPGIWTPSDSKFADADGVNILGDGACITLISNVRCTPADQTTCDAAGATLCFQSKDVDGIGNVGVSICAWDVDQADCASTDGIWTSTGSTFQQNNPNSVPPSNAGACISQVTNFE